jgi:hypothetical protein
MARQHTTKKKVTHYTLMLIFVQQQQAALPTPYGSTNGSSIRHLDHNVMVSVLQRVSLPWNSNNDSSLPS